MNWRYQPVYVDHPQGRVMTVCECYFDDSNLLDAWTCDQSITPQGETTEELQADLARMLADAYKWEPVKFSSLHVGMTFERTGADVEAMIAAMDAAKGVVT